MNIAKWSFDDHEYHPYVVPDDVTVVLYSEDMDLPINCASCFKDMTYGEGFTSRTLHTNTGLGYPVCENCYEKEFAGERDKKQ